MGLDITGLSVWVDENQTDLIRKSILKGRTVDFISVQPGIKHSATINKLESTVTGQAGACGWNSLGSTALTQRTITVCPIKINEAICLNTLESYYTSVMMNPGSYDTSIPFEEIYAEEKAGQIQAMIEDIIWKGDTSGSGNLALCNGFIKLVDGLTASTVSGNPASQTGAITAGNAIATIDNMVSLVPLDVIAEQDLTIFLSYADYRTYSTALRNANLFAYDGNENQGGEFMQMVPGTNVKVVAIRGLNGQGGDMILTPAKNLYLGTDLLNDSENFNIRYSADNFEVRFSANFKIGVELAYPEFVVHYAA